MIKNVLHHEYHHMTHRTSGPSAIRPAVPRAEFTQRILGCFRDKVKTEGLLVLKCSGKLATGSIIPAAADLKLRRVVKNLVIVPGAKEQINAAIKEFNPNYVPKFVGGRRVTPSWMMDLVERVYQKILTRIMAGLRDYNPEPLMYGVFYGQPVSEKNRTGNITQVEPITVISALFNGQIAVLAPLGLSETGDGRPDSLGSLCLSSPYAGAGLSFNADDAAAWIAKTLGATQLLLATDKGGIEAHGKMQKEITVSALARLINKSIVRDGMVVKARACMTAVAAGVPVRVINGSNPDSVTRALREKCGTAVVR
jgi:acetylglutamate kinase